MKFKGATTKWTKKLKVAIAALTTAAAVALGGAFTAVGISVAARNQKLGGSLAGGVADNTTTNVTIGEGMSYEIATASDWEKVIAAESTSTAYAEAKLTANITADSATHSFGTAANAFNGGALNVPANKYIVLDLNGYTVNRGLTEAVENGSVITSNGSLVIRDTSASANGKITGGNTTGSGGGIYAEGGNLMIAGGAVSNNVASEGGGVYVNGLLTMTGGIISENEVNGEEQFGGAIYFSDVATVKMSGGLITKHNALRGAVFGRGTFEMSGGEISYNTGNLGAAFYIAQANLTISGNAKIINNASTASGAIYCNTGAQITMTGGVISNNSARTGGSVHVAGTFEMSGGTISGNHAELHGGGVHVAGAFTMNGGEISGNTADSSGGGIYVTSDATCTMNGGTISGNTAGVNGGGIYSMAAGELNDDGSIKTAGLTISNGTISQNKSNGSSSGATNGGGGIYLASNATALIKNANVSQNVSACRGGGIYVYGGRTTVGGNSFKTPLVIEDITLDGNVSHFYGGGIYTYTAGVRVTIKKGVISNNTTERYSGGAVLGNDNTEVTIGDSSSSEKTVKFIGNKSQDSAGALDLQGVATICNAEFTGNTADSNGGAIYARADGLSLTNVTITDNTAYNMGGGIYIDTTTTLNNVTVTNNTSGSLGGGIMVIGQTELSGKIVVKDNYLIQPPETIKNNMFLNSTQQLLTYGTIQSGSEIGVSGGGERTVYTGNTSATRPTFTADNSLWKIDSTTSGSTVTVKLVKNVPDGITDSNAGLWNYAALHSSDTNPIQVDLSANWTWSSSGFGSGTGFNNGLLYVPRGKNIILHLNGYNIDRGLTSAADNGYIFDVQGTLTIIGSGNITGGYNNGDGGAFNVAGGKLVISGGTITGNTAANDSSGGAIYGISSTIIINGGTISNNTATSGGGVYTMDSLIINGGTISGNTATDYGGGVVCGFDVTISGGTITGNSAGYGGGVYISGRQGTAEIGGNAIIHTNTATYGGGIYVDSKLLTISGGQIYGNTATRNGGGVHVYSELKMTGGDVYSNKCTSTIFGDAYGGGGIYVEGEFIMEGGRIRNNSSETIGGGIMNASIVTVSGGTISGNTSNTSGGGLYSYAGELTISGGTISGNTAVRGGGFYSLGALVKISGTAEICGNEAIPYNGQGGYGAGIYMSADSSNYINNTPSEITGGKIYNNSAQGNCGGILLNNDSGHRHILKISGGEIYNNTTTGGRVGGILVERSAELQLTGGKIYGHEDIGLMSAAADSTREAGKITISGGEIFNNTATYGGGVYLNGDTTISGGKIYNNTATYAGGVYAHGGTLTMEGGEIYGNTADYGGGVYVDGTGTFKMTGGTVTGNKAVRGAGVYVYSTGTATIGGEISGNILTKEGENGAGVYVDGTVTLSGDFYILGNTLADGKTASNLYLPSGKTFNVYVFAETGRVGVSADSLRKVTGSFQSTPAELKRLTDTFAADEDGVAIKYGNDSGVGLYLVAGKKLTVTDNGGNVRTVTVEEGAGIRTSFDADDGNYTLRYGAANYYTFDVSDIPVGYAPYLYYTSDTSKTERTEIIMDMDREVSIGYKAVEKAYTIFYITDDSNLTDAQLADFAKQSGTAIYGYSGSGLTDSGIEVVDENGVPFVTNGDYAVKEFATRQHFVVSRVVGKTTVDGTGTQVIKVYLEAKKYAVTFNLNGASVPDGMTADDFMLSLEYGETYTAPVSDMSRPAYEFLGWFDKPDATEDDTPVDFGTGLTVSQEVTYYAGWKLVGYKLTLNYDIHERDTAAIYTYELFNGQRVMVVRNNDWQYNKLERFIYTMAYGESAAAQELITWAPGNSQIRIAEPAAEGFTFAGWYNANGQRVRYIYSNTEYDVELWARWTPATYNISFNANHGSISQAESIGSYTNFAPYGKLPEPTRSGHAFGGWYLTQEAADEGESEGNQNYVDSQTYMVLKGPATLYASWKPIQHRITYTEEYGEGITAENIGRLYVNGKSWQSAVDRVDYGATVSIAVQLADDVSGYEVSVTQNGRPLGNPGTLIVRGDIEIVAHFTEITYNIRYSYNGGNAVGNDETDFVKQYTANSDGTVDLPTSVERVGYEFKGWMLQTFDTTTDSTFYIIDGMRSYLKDHGGLRSVVLYAYWTPATLNVYLHKNFNGNDSNPDMISGVTGDRVTVDLTSIGAEENYILLGWATSPNSTNIAVAVGTDKDGEDYGKGVYTIKPETKTKNADWHESINNLYAVWHVAGAQTLIMSTSLQDGATVKEYDGNSFNLTARPLITYSETDTTLVLTYEWVKDGELVGEKIVRTAADFKGDRNEWLTVTLPIKNVSQSGTYTCNLTVTGSTVTGETMAMTSGSITVTVDKAEFANVRLTNSFGNTYKGYKGEGYTYFAQYQPLGSGNWVNAASNMLLGDDLITVTYVYTLGDEVVEEMVNAGTYTVTAKFRMPDGSNYEDIADRTCLFEVLPLVIDSVTYKLYGTDEDGELYEVNGFKDVFNGREFKVVASASVVDGETFVLTDCDDLTIEITDNTAVNAGVYSAALTGLLGGEAADNYTLRIAENLTCDYEIEKATHNLKDVKFDDLRVDYDGDSHEIFLTYKGQKVADGGVIDIDGFKLTVGYSLEYTAYNAFNHENESKNGGVAAGVYAVTVSLTDAAANVNNFNAIEDISRTLTIAQKDFFDDYDREDMLGGFKTASVGYTTDESRFPKPVIDGADGDMSFNSGIFTVTYTYEQYRNNAYWTIFSGDAKALENFKGLGDPGSYRLTAQIAFAGGSDENEAYRNNYAEVGDITITYSIAEGTIVDITVKLVDGFQFFYGDKFNKSAIESINIQYQVAGNRDATRDEINESVIYDGESGTEVFTTFDRVGSYSVRISFFGEERKLTFNVKQKISEIAEWQYKLTSAPDTEASWKAIPAGGIEYNVAGYDFRAKFACIGTNGFETYGYAGATAEGSSLTVRDNAYALTAADSVGNYLLGNQSGALKGEVKIIRNTSVTVKWYFDGEEITEDTEIIFGGKNKNFINNNFASLITVRYSIGGSEARPLSWDIKDGNGTPVIDNAGDYVLVAVQGSAVDSNYALQGLEKIITVKPYVLSGADYTVEYEDAENGWCDLSEVNYELTYKGEEYKLRVSVRGEVETTIGLVAVDGETEIAIRNAGNYNIICGADNYVLEDVLHGLKINKKSIKVEWAYENNATSLTYNGDEQGVVGTVKGCGTDGNDLIELSGHRQVNAGDRYIAFADLKTDAANPDKNYANNYVLTNDSFDWVIGKLAFKVNGWGSEKFEYEYTGSVQSPSCDDNNIFAQDKSAINVILSYKAGELDIPANEVVSVDNYTVTATLRAAANADPNIVNNYSFENVTCEFAIVKATPKFTGFEYIEYKDETTTNRAYLNSPDGLREDKIVATFDGATVEGRFVFVDGKGDVIDGADVSLGTLGRNTFNIRFIPEDDDSYESVDATMDVVIYQDTSRTGDNSLIVDASRQNFFIMPSTVRVNLVKVYRTYSSYYYDEVLQRAFGKSEEVDASDLEFKINGQDADGYVVKESDFSDGALSGTLTLNVAYKNSNNRIRGAATLNISKEQPLSIRLDETTLSKTWYEDETFNYADASFVVDYASGERNLPANQVSCDVTRFTAADAAAGTKIITFTFGGQSCQVTVDVLARKQLRAEYATDGYKVVGDGKTPVTDWKNYCTITFVTADGETVNAADINGLTVSYVLFLNNNRVDNPVSIGVTYSVRVSFTLNDKRFKSSIAEVTFSLTVTDVAYSVDFEKPADTSLVYDGGELICPEVIINGVTDLQGNPVAGTVRPEYKIVFKGQTVSYIVDAGEYTVTVTFTLGGEEIGKTTYTVHVEMGVNAVESFEVGSILVGGTVSPEAEFKFGEKSQVKFLYSYNGANGQYVSTVPTAAGEYWVIAVMEGTGNYERLESAAKRFTINEVSVSSDSKVEEDAKLVISDEVNGIEYGVEVDVTESEKSVNINKQNTLESYDLSILLGNNPAKIANAVTVRLLISEELKGRTDLNVYFVNGSGNAVNVNAKVSEDGKYLEFTASDLESGKLVITYAQPGQPTGLIVAVVVLGVLAAGGVIACGVVFAKKRRNK